MNTIALIILLASLLLAAGSAYWFLQWKSLTRLTKLTQIIEEMKTLVPEEESHQINEFDPDQWAELSPVEIRQAKIKLTKAQKDLKAEVAKTQKAIKEESDEEEKTKHQDKLTQLQELSPKLEDLTKTMQPVEKKEDFQAKVYGYWNYVYAGGIALLVFGLSWGVGNLLTKKMKGESG